MGPGDSSVSPLRVVFAGTPDFAIPTLELLLGSPQVEVVAVVTRPDRPRGRGRRLAPPAVKVRSQEVGLPLLQPARAAELADSLAPFAPQAGVVVAYGQILPPTLLALPGHGWINLHASLLPRYRGAAPMQHTLLQGERESGATIMLLDQGMDSGPLLAQERVAIPPEADCGWLHDTLSRVGARLLLPALLAHARGEIEPTPQDHRLATLAPRLSARDRILDWNQPRAQVCNRVRAFAPRPGAATWLEGRRLKVLAAVPGREAGALKGAIPGTVTSAGRRGLGVACSDGELLLTRVQPAGGRPQEAAAFLAGHPLAPGARCTSQEEL